MKNNIKIITHITNMLFSVSVFLLFCGFSTLFAQNWAEREILLSRYVPTINDDFSDNSLIVTLWQEYSDVNKVIDVESFRKALSDRSMIDSIEDLTFMTNPSMISNRASFSQILYIKLIFLNSETHLISLFYTS